MAARIPPVLITVPPPVRQQQHQPPSQIDWKTPDVHYWSREMATIVLAEYPSLPADTVALDSRFDEAAAQIKKVLPELIPVLDKMERRRACVDHDLAGVKPTGLLAKVWFDYVCPSGSTALFRDTMVDIGGTCVQGDTHRLFSAMVAIDRATTRHPQRT